MPQNSVVMQGNLQYVTSVKPANLDINYCTRKNGFLDVLNRHNGNFFWLLYIDIIQKEDMSGSSSNHALNKIKLRRDILDCLTWFESSPYWTKCNFMLELMKSCNAQLLHMIGNESRSFCLVHDDQYLSETESKHVEELGNVLVTSGFCQVLIELFCSVGWGVNRTKTSRK